MHCWPYIRLEIMKAFPQVDLATLPDGTMLLALNDNATARSPPSSQSAVVNPNSTHVYYML